MHNAASSNKSDFVGENEFWIFMKLNFLGIMRDISTIKQQKTCSVWADSSSSNWFLIRKFISRAWYLIFRKIHIWLTSAYRNHITQTKKPALSLDRTRRHERLLEICHFEIIVQRGFKISFSSKDFGCRVWNCFSLETHEKLTTVNPEKCFQHPPPHGTYDCFKV